jgi:hypothetical protein
VAEKARVPLYTVRAGMLGTSPEVVEPALTHALELCRLWNAMLLLDEADVFLGCRLDESQNRNELVSSRSRVSYSSLPDSSLPQNPPNPK